MEFPRHGVTVFPRGVCVRMAPAITSIVLFSGFIECCMSFCCLGGWGGHLKSGEAGVLYPQVLSCSFVSLLICTLFVVFYYCIATINIVWYSASCLHLFIEVALEQSFYMCYICLLWVFIKRICIDMGLIFS